MKSVYSLKFYSKISGSSQVKNCGAEARLKSRIGNPMIQVSIKIDLKN